jgi:hypothetical protein
MVGRGFGFGFDVGDAGPGAGREAERHVPGGRLDPRHGIVIEPED